MTREEALKELAEWREQMKNHGVPDYGKKLMALGVAIEALSSADTDMSDYCDRLWKIAYERGKADRPTVDKEYLIDLIQEAVYDGEACAKLIDLVDRPTGEWINREKCQVDEDAYEVATCSECGAEITIEYPHDSYCPNCGAKMRGDSDG